MFRRIGTVTAVRLTEPRAWTTSSGDQMSGEEGDWLVTDAKGGERTVKDSEFPSLYQLLPDGTYQGIGTVTARQATATETVDTLEGPATANPGDWVVTAADGSSWPVPDEVFRTKYQEITSDG
jgi:hypothetical protein